VAALLAPVTMLPGPGRAAHWRADAAQKRLAIWSRTGRHDAVLRATERLPADVVSTALTVRSASLRITGSLDEAAATASLARQQALREHHPVRVAHAAFQQSLALLWAERLDEARRCLAECFEPHAAIAASRWVAWADFVGGGLGVRDAGAGSRDTAEALARFALSEARFRAEALLDGVVSVMTARLAAHRAGHDDDAFQQELAALLKLASRGQHGQRYFTRRNSYTAESILIERAEFARARQHRQPCAWRRYQRAAASRYPLHAALGHLGLALIEADRGDYPEHATTAARIAGTIGCQLISRRASEILHPGQEDPLRQVFFC